MSDKKPLSGADILMISTAASEAIRAEFEKLNADGFVVTVLDSDRVLEALVAARGSLITTRAFTQEEMLYRE